MKKIKILTIIPTLQDLSIGEKKKEFTRKRDALNMLAKKSNIELTTCIFLNKSETFSINSHFLQSRVNTGFTGAVNSAVLANYQQDYDWFLVLNDDAVVKLDFFVSLTPLLRKKHYAVISCGVENESGHPESFGLIYHKNGLAFPLTDSKKISNEFFCGTAFLVSKECVQTHIEREGYFFHPLYFAYAEDLELSIRMKQYGEKMFIYPKTLVVHKGSQTAKRGSEFQLYYSYRNVLLTIFFHWSLRQIIFRLPWIIMGQCYCFLVTLKNKRLKIYLRIVWYFIKNLHTLLFLRAKYHSQPTRQSMTWDTTVMS